MNVEVVQKRLWETLQAVEKHLESRMRGNLHVRFGVGAGGETLRFGHIHVVTIGETSG